MHTAIFACLFLLALILNSQQVTLPTEKQTLTDHGVTILDDQIFVSKTGIDAKDEKKQLTGQGDWVVLFYASWCGHCRKFINDVYSKMESNLTQLDFKVSLAAIDCPTSKQICKDFLIAAYPTIKYFRHDGKRFTYPRGIRDISNVMEFIKKSHNGEQYVISTASTTTAVESPPSEDTKGLTVTPVISKEQPSSGQSPKEKESLQTTVMARPAAKNPAKLHFIPNNYEGEKSQSLKRGKQLGLEQALTESSTNASTFTYYVIIFIAALITFIILAVRHSSKPLQLNTRISNPFNEERSVEMEHEGNMTPLSEQGERTIAMDVEEEVTVQFQEFEVDKNGKEKSPIKSDTEQSSFEDLNEEIFDSFHSQASESN